MKSAVIAIALGLLLAQVGSAQITKDMKVETAVALQMDLGALKDNGLRWLKEVAKKDDRQIEVVVVLGDQRIEMSFDELQQRLTMSNIPVRSPWNLSCTNPVMLTPGLLANPN